MTRYNMIIVQWCSFSKL